MHQICVQVAAEDFVDRRNYIQLVGTFLGAMEGPGDVKRKQRWCLFRYYKYKYVYIYIHKLIDIYIYIIWTYTYEYIYIRCKLCKKNRFPTMRGVGHWLFSKGGSQDGCCNQSKLTKEATMNHPWFHMDVSKKQVNTPKWMVHNGKPYILRWMIWEYPFFGNTHMFQWLFSCYLHLIPTVHRLHHGGLSDPKQNCTTPPEPPIVRHHPLSAIVCLLEFNVSWLIDTLQRLSIKL